MSEYSGYSKPSVSRALKILREGNYIEVSQAGYITLTESGAAVANKIYERHQVISQLLIAWGVDEEIAVEDACRIEHVISDQSFEKVKQQASIICDKDFSQD